MATATFSKNGKVLGRFSNVSGLKGFGIERGGNVVADARSKFREAQKKNEERYKRILKGYKQRQKDVMGTISDIGTQSREDIRERGRRTKGEVTQKMISRGMGSTTVLPAMRSGVDERTQDSIGRLDSQLAGQKATALSGLKADTLSFMERRQDAYPNISQLAQQMRQKGETDAVGDMDIPSTPGLGDRPAMVTQRSTGTEGTEGSQYDQQQIEYVKQYYPDRWKRAVNDLRTQGIDPTPEAVRTRAEMYDKPSGSGGSGSSGSSQTRASTGSDGMVSGGMREDFGQKVGEYILDYGGAPASVVDTASKLANGREVSLKKYAELQNWYYDNRGV